VTTISLSASNLWRREACPASAHLPRTSRIHADALAGTEEHARLEDETPAGERSEVAFVFNAETGEAREIGEKLGRNYPASLGPEWIPGTTDLLRVEENRVVVTDHKTGHGYMVASAKSNLQLAHYALAAATVYGKSAARIEIRREGAPPDIADLDVLDLAAARERIRSVWRRVLKSSEGEPRVVEGDQCWRCEAFSRCPAKVNLALSLASGEATKDLPTLELTPPAVAVGWMKLQAIKKVLSEVERVYRGFASSVDVALPNGKVLGEVTRSREELDARVVRQTLRELHGEEVADAAVEYDTSKAAIERALKPIAKRGQLAGMIRTALDAIQADNGISRKTSHVVEEH